MKKGLKLVFIGVGVIAAVFIGLIAIIITAAVLMPATERDPERAEVEIGFRVPEIGFRDAKWGMSNGEVRETEGGKLPSEARIFDRRWDVDWVFEDDQLIEGSYTTFLPLATWESTFDSFLEVMHEKYGSPDALNKEDKAIFAKWVAGDTDIMCVAAFVDNSPDLALRVSYTSRSHPELLNQRRKRENAEKRKEQEPSRKQL